MKHVAYLAFVAATLSLFAHTGCGGIEDTRTPSIIVPNEVTFSEVPIGDIQQRTVFVENPGQGTLRIFEVEVRSNTNFISVDPPSLEVEPGGEGIITVSYQPTDPTLSETTLVLQTNVSGANETVSIPVVVARPTPRVTLFPSIVDFGLVAVDSSSSIDVQLQNIGTGPLIICDAFVTGSPDFTTDVRDMLDAMAGSGGFAVIPPSSTINPGRQAVDFSITYQPPSPGPDSADLVVVFDAEGFESRPCANEAQQNTVRFPINGEAGAPTLSVSPNPLNFGQTPIDFQRREVITLQNIGQLNLDIYGVRLDTNVSSPYFTLLDAPTGQFTLEREEISAVEIGYRPRNDESHAGVLVIDHDDGAGNQVSTRVTLAGFGVEATCPVAVGRGFAREDDQNRRGSEIDWALPLQTLVLDGTESFAPDGIGLSDYVWEIVSKPPEAVNGLRPFQLVPDNPAFSEYFIPVAGRYEFRLTVYDDAGFESCSPATVTVIATPQQTLAIELTWHNPLDPDETDNDGSDVDLHLVRMPYSWFHPTFDTYFANPAPNWNPERPSLDIDDTDGAGPEIIQLDNPANGECYAIGAHYFRQKFGTAYLTVKIYVDGALRDEIYGELRETDDFWDVARIHFPSRTIYRADIYYQNFDANAGFAPAPTDEMIRNGHCATVE